MPFGKYIAERIFKWGKIVKKELKLEMVQGQIGYRFKNRNLLEQTFTRRSYTEENGGENNEVLELIGDKVLDYTVVNLLIKNTDIRQT